MRYFKSAIALLAVIVLVGASIADVQAGPSKPSNRGLRSSRQGTS
jgi:hypothetical protein